MRNDPHNFRHLCAWIRHGGISYGGLCNAALPEEVCEKAFELKGLFYFICYLCFVLVAKNVPLGFLLSQLSLLRVPSNQLLNNWYEIVRGSSCTHHINHDRETMES